MEMAYMACLQMLHIFRVIRPCMFVWLQPPHLSLPLWGVLMMINELAGVDDDSVIEIVLQDFNHNDQPTCALLYIT